MSKKNEAHACIKINQLLMDAGWSFFPNGNGGKANIQCKYLTEYKKSSDKLGNEFEKTEHGFLDFQLHNDKGFHIAFVEAKKDSMSHWMPKSKPANTPRALVAWKSK